MRTRIVENDLVDSSLLFEEADATRAISRSSRGDLLTIEERSWRVLVRSLFPKNRPRTLIGLCFLNDAGSINALTTNLAAYAAEYLKTSVLIVEAHRNQPPLAETLGAASAPGLSDLLSSPAEDAPRSIHKTRLSRLWILPFGHVTQTALARRPQEDYPRILKTIPTDLRHVIVALPPLSNTSSTTFPHSLLDRVVLAVRPNSVASRNLRKAVDRLTAMDATVAGVVWVDACPIDL